MGFQSSINAVLGTGAAIAVASKKLSPDALKQRKAVGADKGPAAAPEQRQANEYIPVSELKAAQAESRIVRNVVQKQTQKQAVSRRKQLLQARIKSVIGGLDSGIDK